MIARSGRGFSLVEFMIALTISALLLTACLVALDSSFKAYEVTTEGASTHVVSRLVMHRALAMIRQGEEFGPYPYSVVGPTRLESSSIEFVSLNDPGTGRRHITRLERAVDPQSSDTWQLRYQRREYLNGTLMNTVSYPLLRNLQDLRFTLEYDVGPTLRRATIDMTVRPNDASVAGATALFTDLEAPTLRLIASTSPRRLDP